MLPLFRRRPPAVPIGTYTTWSWPPTASGYPEFSWALEPRTDPSPVGYFWSHQVALVGGSPRGLGGCDRGRDNRPGSSRLISAMLRPSRCGGRSGDKQSILPSFGLKRLTVTGMAMAAPLERNPSGDAFAFNDPRMPSAPRQVCALLWVR